MAIQAQTLPNNATTITGPVTIVQDGNLQSANLSVGGNISGGVVIQTIATSPANTISAAGRVASITGAGIATCAMAPGTNDGQEVTILNLGAASTVVSAASNGLAVNATLASLACQSFLWNAATNLWYHKA